MKIDLDETIKRYEEARDGLLKDLEHYLVMYEEIPIGIKAGLSKAYHVLRELNGIKYGVCEICGTSLNNCKDHKPERILFGEKAKNG